MSQEDDTIPEELAASKLDQLLGSFQAEGRLDSQGGFSLDPIKALQKLGDFALPRPQAWLLPAVQAAVAGGCTGCEIDLSRKRVECLLTPSPPVELRAVVERTLAGEMPGTPAEGFLSTLIRIAVARGWTMEMRQLSPHGEGIGMTLEPDSLVWETPRGERKTEDVLAIRFSRPAAAKVREERQELLERAHLAPLELTVNGQRLDTFDRELSWGLDRASRELNLAVAAHPHPKGFQAPEDAPPALKEQRLECCALIESRSPRSLVEYRWLRYGVVIQEETLFTQDDVQAQVTIHADDLKTDLTGFGLKETPLKSERRALARSVLAQAVKEALETVCAQHIPAKLKKDRFYRAFQGITLGGLGMWAFYLALHNISLSFVAGWRLYFLLLMGLYLLMVSAFLCAPIYLFLRFLYLTFIGRTTGLEKTLEELERLHERLSRND